MNKTSIEWVKNPDGTQGYTWNPITGCLNHDNGLCRGGGFPCYAYKLANGRLKPLYLANPNYAPAPDISDYFFPARHIEDKTWFGDPFYPRFWEERLFEPVNKTWEWGRQRRMVSSQYPKGIFVCDMGDLFGIGIPEEWTRRVLERFQYAPRHRFYLLTKQPQNLIKFSPFPDNCWVGVTATQDGNIGHAESFLSRIQAKVKYISIEPMLEEMGASPTVLKESGINWLIIGACTGTFKEMYSLVGKYPQLDLERVGTELPTRLWTAQPKIEWVRERVGAADKAGVKVFLKDNLKPLVDNEPTNPLYWVNVSNDERGNERVDDSLRQELPE